MDVKTDVKRDMKKVAYGFLFVVVWPAFLVLFSWLARVPFPAVRAPVAGVAVAGAGLLVMVAAMLELWIRGEGPPMNAFPPKRLVVRGLYAVLPHPIYVGFTVAVLGASLWAGSAAGFWLATPLAALACLALVVGYERIDLKRRFGALPDPVLGPRRWLLPALRFLRVDRLWHGVLRLTEWFANSWRARRFGRIRVMNHVVFSGLGGGLGAFFVVWLVGRELSGLVSVLMVVGALGAVLFGQLLEGSSDKLSRPFGYFGSLLGVTLVVLALVPFVPSAFLVLTAFAFGAPWTCAIGRMRCIVQGCCHGAPSDPAAGIVVRNEHSRVCGMAGLCRVPIYPTQLYSILGNLLVGAAMVALWAASAPMALVCGAYLALSAVVRFIEEGYRGEPQTKKYAGLHSYQWFSVVMFLAGMLLMMVPSAAVPAARADSLGTALWVGAVFVVVCGCAMSVDFPDSKAKFTRLSG